METTSEYKLQENMTFQVDTFVRDKEFGLRWETGAVIKEDGIELLSDKIKGIVNLKEKSRYEKTGSTIWVFPDGDLPQPGNKEPFRPRIACYSQYE